MEATSQDIAIFEGSAGEVVVTVGQETVWLTQTQMVPLFDGISRLSPDMFAISFRRASFLLQAICKKCILLAVTSRSPFTRWM